MKCKGFWWSFLWHLNGIHKLLVIGFSSNTPCILFLIIFFRIVVVKKAFDVAMSTSKLSLCTTYNHISVLFHVWSKLLLICHKLSVTSVTSCQKFEVTTLFQLFESCQKEELKLFKLVTVISKDFVLELCLLLFWEWYYLSGRWESLQDPNWEGDSKPNGGIWHQRWGRIEPREAM